MSGRFYTKIVDVITDQGADSFTETFMKAHVDTKTDLPCAEDFFCDDDLINERYQIALREFNERFFRENIQDLFSHLEPEMIADIIVREVKPKPLRSILGTQILGDYL